MVPAIDFNKLISDSKYSFTALRINTNRKKRNKGLEAPYFEVSIAIKGLIRTKPVVEPSRSADSTTGYGFYLLNPCYILRSVRGLTQI